MGLFHYVKKNDQLETKLRTLQMNFENNYKDAAKMNYEEYWKLFEQLKASGKIKGSSVEYYQKRGDDLHAQMDNFNHQNNVKSF